MDLKLSGFDGLLAGKKLGATGFESGRDSGVKVGPFSWATDPKP